MAPRPKKTANRPSMRASSSRAPDEDYDHTFFVSEAAANLCQKFLEGMVFLGERGFLCTEPLSIRYLRPALDRGWGEFLKHPPDGARDLCREFYANASVLHDHDQVFVRGKMVAFDSRTINTMFQIPIPEVDEFSAWRQGAIDYEAIVARVCMPGGQWMFSRTGSRTLMQRDLTPEANMWFGFFKARITPTSHTTAIPAERILFLYAFLTGMPIDLGRVLRDHITACFQRPRSLWFPSLITDLCSRAGVILAADVERVPSLGAITDAKLMELRREEYRRGQGARAQPAQPRQAPARAPPPPQPPTQRELLHQLQQRVSQIEITQYHMMQFQNESTAVLEQMMRRIALRQGDDLIDFPTFPRHSIDDLGAPTPPTEEEEDPEAMELDDDSDGA
jgi:hypothetical protein